MTKRICDLPPELIGKEILSKVPITSLKEVRSTCKLWESLSKDYILGEAAARQQFMGFVTIDSKVCSMRFQFHKDEDLVDLSIKPVDLLNQVNISKVFQCNGLLLCVTKNNSSLMAWNPYLGQTRWIRPRTSFHRLDRYAFGYDKKNLKHKILRLLDDSLQCKHCFGFEIYDFSSNSWRVIEVRPDWDVEFYQRGASLKGNTYFIAREKFIFDPGVVEAIQTVFGGFLLCFDFTRERFGPLMPLPFYLDNEETATLSCVRDQQLALLHQQGDSTDALEVWVTTMIEPNAVSWSKFLNVDMRPLTSVGVGRFDCINGSFFINEEEKVAVVFDVDGFLQTETARYHTAFIIGEDEYIKTVSLGEAPNVYIPEGVWANGYVPQYFSPPLVCSASYLPSLVQLNQPLKRKERDDDDFRFVSCKSKC